jgi:hypothetical protein
MTHILFTMLGHIVVIVMRSSPFGLARGQSCEQHFPVIAVRLNLPKHQQLLENASYHSTLLPRHPFALAHA